jgi:hypothetical protein
MLRWVGTDQGATVSNGSVSLGRDVCEKPGIPWPHGDSGL